MTSRLDRVARRFRANRLVAAALLCGLCSGFAGQFASGQATKAPARFSVTPEQVLQAMQGRDWPLNGVEVHLAAPVTASVAEAALEIESVSPRTGHEILLRLACRIHTECLPFFASATWPANVPAPSLAAASGSATGSPAGDRARATRSPADPGLLAANQAANPSPRAAPAPPVLRAGTPATLLLEGARIHIQLPVVLAQDGHVGDTVRVTTPNRKQTYVAEVLTPRLLKGKI